ncbi:MAG: hypothetical protein ACI8TP_003982 [Acidimicrobiales bacterium]|jgi:sporulation protein YlmC with PRC-barrel domain
MRLRIGQPVNATDGAFGELADIVVDPQLLTVTNVVVQPEHRHRQARLVPVWLLKEEDGTLFVNLDVAHFDRLERVSFSDYVTLDEPIDLGDTWDLGTEDVLSTPYLYGPYVGYEFDMGWYDDRVGISYDRIPKCDCEIRRSSEVATSNDKIVGHVEGLVSDDEHITAVVVGVGIPGFRHDVLVPLGAVAKVRNDRIELSISEEQFDLLPSTDVLGHPDDLSSHVTDLQQRAEAIAAKLATRGRSLITEAKSRVTTRTENR